MIPTPTQVRILHYLAKCGDRGERPANIGFHLYPRKLWNDDSPGPRGPRNAQGAAFAVGGQLRALQQAALITRTGSYSRWRISMAGMDWVQAQPEAENGR